MKNSTNVIHVNCKRAKQIEFGSTEVGIKRSTVKHLFKT